MNELGPLERCKKVLHVEMPERVPVVPQSLLLSLTTAGMQMKDVVHHGKKMARSHIICQEKYGYDGCVIDYCRRACVVFAKAQKDAGAHATSIGDAFAGPDLISPGQFRQFALEPEPCS